MRDKKDNSKRKQKSAKKDPPPFEEAFDRCFPEWCESLDSYMEVINFARSEEYGLGADEYTEVHHIVPRSWYEKHGYKIDNSEKNTVRLRMRDHYKVHFYARLCCSSEVKRSLQCAFGLMSGILKCDVPEEWLNEKAILVEVQKVDKKFGSNGGKGKKASEEARRKMSEAKKGENNPNYGRTGENHPMYGITGENNPNYGKHLSEETKRKKSESMKGDKNPNYGKVSSRRKHEHGLLTDPDGQIYDVYDLYEFCKSHFENAPSATHTLRDYGKYKGWTYQIVDKEDKQ